jgi:hypothetical protein
MHTSHWICTFLKNQMLHIVKVTGKTNRIKQIDNLLIKKK